MTSGEPHFYDVREHIVVLGVRTLKFQQGTNSFGRPSPSIHTTAWILAQDVFITTPGVRVEQRPTFVKGECVAKGSNRRAGIAERKARTIKTNGANRVPKFTRWAEDNCPWWE